MKGTKFWIAVAAMIAGGLALAVHAEGAEKSIGSLVRQLEDAGEGARWEAAQGLAEAGEAAVSPLLGALGKADAKVQTGAAYALGKIGDGRAVDPLMDLLKNGGAEVQAAAACALGRIGDDRAEDLLDERFNDDGADERVRVCAAYALGEIQGYKKHFDFVRDHLRADDAEVRFRAAVAAGLIGERGFSSYLKRAWRSEEETGVKAALSFALFVVDRENDALDHLILNMDSDDATARYFARRFLVELVEQRVRDLQTGGNRARKDYALDLCNIGHTAEKELVVKKVVPLLKSSNEETRDSAAFTFG